MKLKLLCLNLLKLDWKEVITLVTKKMTFIHLLQIILQCFDTKLFDWCTFYFSAHFMWRVKRIVIVSGKNASKWIFLIYVCVCVLYRRLGQMRLPCNSIIILSTWFRFSVQNTGFFSLRANRKLFEIKTGS